MHLWSKFRIILRYIYQFRNDYDYFLKTDDDAYVIMENLLNVLQNYSPDMPFMLGHRFPVNNVYLHLLFIVSCGIIVECKFLQGSLGG